jgi:hypothetical protein
MRAIDIGFMAASVCICLPLIYWITAPDWWRSRAGRALMMLLGSLAALFILLLTSRLVADPTVREVLRYIIYSSVLVAGVRLAILFFQLRFGADWAKNRGDKQ